MKLKIVEVAMLLGVSTKTIENWYMWKHRNPEHELARLLPDFEQAGARQTRYWKMADVEKMAEFKEKIPKGRGGIMGEVTQYKKGDKK